MIVYKVKLVSGEYVDVTATTVHWPEYEGDAVVFCNQDREVVAHFNGRMVEYVVKGHQSGQTTVAGGP